MRTKNFFLLGSVLFILSFAGCKDRSPQLEPTVIHLDFTQVNSKIGISEIFDTINFIKLETKGNSLISGINRIHCYKDSIFISTPDDIKLFDINGRFLCNYSFKGKGPGEYIEVSDFVLDTINKKLEILDIVNQKIIIYDFDGIFYKEFYIGRWVQRYSYLDNNCRVLYSGNDYQEKGKDSKIRILMNFKTLADYLPINIAKSKYLHVDNTTSLSRFGQETILAEPFSDTVYLISKNSVAPKYIVDPGPQTIPNKLFENNFNTILDFFTSLNKNNYVYGIFNFIESSNLAYFRYYQCAKPENEARNILFDKKTKETTIFRSIFDDRYLLNTYLNLEDFKLFKQSNGSIIFAMPAYVFKDKYADAYNKSGERIMSSIKEINRNISNEDNHVLLITHLK